MCRSNFYETGIYSCQLEVKNTFKSFIVCATASYILSGVMFIMLILPYTKYPRRDVGGGCCYGLFASAVASLSGLLLPACICGGVGVCATFCFVQSDIFYL